MAEQKRQAEDQASGRGEGLGKLERFFTRAGIDAFSTVEWEKRNATIHGEKGEIVFEQQDVEMPKAWSQLATNVVVSKYFRGSLGTRERETSVRQLVGRVVRTIRGWGDLQRYFPTREEGDTFADELAYLLLHQYASFNSPVWFNVGVERNPQCSACQPYHARVLTMHGPMAIGEIVERRLVGLPVYDGNGLTQVVAVKSNGRKPVFRLELNDGFSVEATGDHLVCAHDQRRTQHLEWRRVDELQPGMVLRVYPHAAETVTPAGSALEVAEAALAGWLQSDGFVGQYEEGTNRSLTIEFMTNGDEEHAWVLGHVMTAFPDVHHHVRDVETHGEGHKVRRIRLYGEVLRRFVEQYQLELRGLEIRVPDAVSQGSNDAAAAYLKSVFQAEGYAVTHGLSARVALAVISPAWVRDLQVLLTRFGIYSRVRRKNEKRIDRHDLWELDVSIASERRVFADRIGFLSPRKAERLRESLELDGKECPSVRFAEIVAIHPLGEMAVYDIQTQSGQYLSEGVLVHNCFILSIEDKMESILDWYRREGIIFKGGSGSGINLSKIRSSKERLAGGGTASGPVSFMRAADASAGVIKSGGKTRRAAKMVVLNSDHPDILDFIDCKAAEEKKAWALIDAGYDGSLDGPAYSSIFFQNANNSVRVTDEFMNAVAADQEWATRFVTTGEVSETFRARDLMRKIAEAAHFCGDPGMQFHTTINDWHTCPATGPINASNPCVTGDTRVATTEGWLRIDSLVGRAARVIGADGQPHVVTKIFPTGRKPVYRLETRGGYRVRITADHKVWTMDRGDVAVRELQIGDRLALESAGFGRRVLSERLGLAVGVAVAGGRLTRSVGAANAHDVVILTMAADEAGVLAKIAGEINEGEELLAVAGGEVRVRSAVRVRPSSSGVRLAFSSPDVVSLFQDFADFDGGSDGLSFRPSVFRLDRASQAAVLRGLFTAGGDVATDREAAAFVLLEAGSLELLRQVQLLLLGFGIKAAIEGDALAITGASRMLFEREIGFDPDSAKADALAAVNGVIGSFDDELSDVVASIEPAGEEDVYDLTEPATQHFVANGLIVHNCSEYMHLDDSACNLSSLNLMKFLGEDLEFDIPAFRHAIDVMITAQDIVVDNSSYPTAEITKNARDYRELGLGYANLGALLMSLGLPYDSDSGREYAAAVTALMHGEAYLQSVRLAERMGPFAGYEKNREPMLRVLEKHRSHAHRLKPSLVPLPLLAEVREVYDALVEKAPEGGVRNSQVTVLAPTGTIAFMMDCDTTGVEPDIALVKYKKLVGGGLLKIVNNTVPRALRRLGYESKEVQAIVEYIDEMETIEGAPELKAEHLAVFDCAFKAARGSRSIEPLGHIRMMGAVQPFLSGAISKTVNMSPDVTVDDIMETFIEAWRLGLKAVAIYRDGCKRTQPLNTGKKAEAAAVEAPRLLASPLSMEEQKPIRRRLPAERRAVCHKFDIAGHEGYIHVGFYEDGTPGEIFIKMAKEGSTISGLMDTVATLTSLALQYGVPLEALVSKFSHVRFEPSGFTKNPEIPMAKSLADYIFRYMGSRFLDPEMKKEIGLVEREEPASTSPERTAELAAAPRLAAPKPAPAFSRNPPGFNIANQADAPSCPDCGAIMIRNGACYKCWNCGATSGCS